MQVTRFYYTFFISLSLQSVNEKLVNVKAQLQTELENVSKLEAKISELEVCVITGSQYS